MLKIFGINVILAGLLVAIIVWGTFYGLKIYTHHGETITVPDLRGMTIDQVQHLLKNRHLSYQIMDSSYQMDILPNSILDQNPAPLMKVKENRTIYLTINAKNPPKIRMPDLTDKSLKQAKIEMESVGLKIGELIYLPDPAANYVLDQQIDGNTIPKGTLIPKGSKIDLVLGDGLGKSKVLIPKLVGLTYEEATFVMHSYGLNIGAIVYNDSIVDTANAFVVRQVPEYEEDHFLHLGEAIDIFLSIDLPDELKDTLSLYDSLLQQNLIDTTKTIQP